MPSLDRPCCTHARGALDATHAPPTYSSVPTGTPGSVRYGVDDQDAYAYPEHPDNGESNESVQGAEVDNSK